MFLPVKQEISADSETVLTHRNSFISVGQLPVSFEATGLKATLWKLATRLHNKWYNRMSSFLGKQSINEYYIDLHSTIMYYLVLWNLVIRLWLFAEHGAHKPSSESEAGGNHSEKQCWARDMLCFLIVFGQVRKRDSSPAPKAQPAHRSGMKWIENGLLTVAGCGNLPACYRWTRWPRRIMVSKACVRFLRISHWSPR